MADRRRHPIHDIRDQYVPVKDISKYYEDIPESLVSDLIAKGVVGYAELKEIEGTRRIPHVNVVDIFKYLGRDSIIKHPTTRGNSYE